MWTHTVGDILLWLQINMYCCLLTNAIQHALGRHHHLYFRTWLCKWAKQMLACGYLATFCLECTNQPKYTNSVLLYFEFDCSNNFGHNPTNSYLNNILYRTFKGQYMQNTTDKLGMNHRLCMRMRNYNICKILGHIPWNEKVPRAPKVRFSSQVHTHISHFCDKRRLKTHLYVRHFPLF